MSILAYQGKRRACCWQRRTAASAPLPTGRRRCRRPAPGRAPGRRAPSARGAAPARGRPARGSAAVSGSQMRKARISPSRTLPSRISAAQAGQFVVQVGAEGGDIGARGLSPARLRERGGEVVPVGDVGEGDRAAFHRLRRCQPARRDRRSAGCRETPRRTSQRGPRRHRQSRAARWPCGPGAGPFRPTARW